MSFDLDGTKQIISDLEQERDDLADKIDELENALAIKDYAISMQEGKIRLLKDIANELLRPLLANRKITEFGEEELDVFCALCARLKTECVE